MSHSLPLNFARRCVCLSLLLVVIFTFLGCALAYRPEPMLGIVADQTLQVIVVEPNSPALIAGVQPGDILLDLTWESFSNNVRRGR